MKDFVLSIVDFLKMRKVSYGDVRSVGILTEQLTVKDGIVENISITENRGMGIRVLVSGRWGFAAVSSMSVGDVEEAVIRAIKIATSLSTTGREVNLTDEEVYVDSYISEFQKDPFKVSQEDKIALLLSVDDALKGRRIRKRSSSLEFRDFRQIFANTEGSLIEQRFVDSGASLRVVASNSKDVQERTFSSVLRKGYEHIEELNLVKRAEKLVEEVDKLLYAHNCPEGEMDLILTPDHMILQIHESIGHPLELDRVLAFEASYAGTSFASIDKLNNFQYGSEILNVYQDSMMRYGLGTFGYDDEGVKARKIALIKDGILRGYLSSRESAFHIKSSSSGAARAQDWSRIPIVRMTNVNLMPGDSSLEEMISSTKYGILMETSKAWSIDDRRLNFQFGTELGYLIIDGKIKGMVKNPSYTGITPIFWNNLLMVGNAKEFEQNGLTGCSKGEPGQLMGVGHGSPPCKFQKVKVMPSR
ncbi:MAG: TldD/PmbA family protein [Candidatus Hydrothermae bacterium]|nr:TldD/PmbA family protein [Candidatus Hydrothermae bacterium]MDD3648974.1 TldD/PmbA family protein [Candidatus Hydrothermia bacterium]